MADLAVPATNSPTPFLPAAGQATGAAVKRFLVWVLASAC
jgi:hypothetical protein